MKKLILGVMSSGLIAILFLTGGCKFSNLNNPTPAYTEFAVQVDSIQYPDTLMFGKTLNVKFFGTIGPNTCYSFSRFVGGVSQNQIDVAVYGKFTNDTANCAQVVQYLDGKTLNVNLKLPGTYIIHLVEPTHPDIYDTLYVSQPVSPAR